MISDDSGGSFGHHDRIIESLFKAHWQALFPIAARARRRPAGPGPGLSHGLEFTVRLTRRQYCRYRIL